MYEAAEKKQQGYDLVSHWSYEHSLLQSNRTFV